MNVYLEAAGISTTEQEHRQRFDKYLSAPPRRPGRLATGVSDLIAAARAWIERRRLASDLYALDDRLLADAGLTRWDIPALLKGTYERQPESAPVQWPRARKTRRHATPGSNVDHKGTPIAA